MPLYQEGTLDRTSVKILEGMRDFGPRNLLEVSRRTKIPFTSVYHRVARFEEEGVLGPSPYRIYPDINWPAMGMNYRIAVFTAALGREREVEREVTEMEYNLYLRRADVTPPTFLAGFAEPKKKFVEEKYEGINSRLTRMAAKGLVKKRSVFDIDGFLWPCSFEDYDEVSFVKGELDLGELANPGYYLERARAPSDSSASPVRPRRQTNLKIDLKDFIIIRELIGNPRVTYQALAPLLGITLQGVKYHFDTKLNNQVIMGYGIDPRKFPDPTTYTHVFFPKFATTLRRDQFLKASKDFTLVSRIAAVDDGVSLIVETNVPGRNFVNIFEEMEKEKWIKSYNLDSLRFTNNPVFATLVTGIYTGERWLPSKPKPKPKGKRKH